MVKVVGGVVVFYVVFYVGGYGDDEGVGEEGFYFSGFDFFDVRW